MAEMPPLEKYLRKFEDNDRKRLFAARALRLRVRNDKLLPELERAVLGITGSKDVLKAIQQRAQLVSESIGEPIVIVQPQGSSPFLRAMGGIITGPMTATSSATKLRSDRGHSGYVRLEVPVVELVSITSNMVYVGQEVSRGIEAVTVDHFVSTESENSGFDPEDDYDSFVDSTSVYIGRRAMYAELDMKLAAEFVMTIEETAPRAPTY